MDTPGTPVSPVPWVTTGTGRTGVWEDKDDVFFALVIIMRIVVAWFLPRRLSVSVKQDIQGKCASTGVSKLMACFSGFSIYIFLYL